MNKIIISGKDVPFKKETEIIKLEILLEVWSKI